jgi:hypothetical protein
MQRCRWDGHEHRGGLIDSVRATLTLLLVGVERKRRQEADRLANRPAGDRVPVDLDVLADDRKPVKSLAAELGEPLLTLQNQLV